LRHDEDVSKITVAVPDLLAVAMNERMREVGALSQEDYLLSLVEADCATAQWEQLLAQRLAGPFLPLPADWKEQVRRASRERSE
jgi:hypothetical protein